MALGLVCLLLPPPSSEPLLAPAVFALPTQQAQMTVRMVQMLLNRRCSRVSWAAEQTARGLSGMIVVLTDDRGRFLHGDLYPVPFQPILSTHR